jgi:hypothetical protein
VKTTGAEELGGYRGALLPILLETQHRQPGVAPHQEGIQLPRPRMWLKALVVAGAAVGIAVVIPALSDDPLEGAIAVEHRGKVIHLSVQDASADPEAMTNDLRAAGLDARVEVVPVSPSLVGMWVNFFSLGPNGDADPRGLDIWNQMYPPGDPSGIPRARVLKIPSDFSTAFTAVVGRPAHEGETWQQANISDVPDETSDGGIVYCLGLEPSDTEGVDRALEDLGYERVWSLDDPDMPSSERVAGPPPGKVIVGAELLGPDVLLISTAEPETPAARAAVTSHARHANDC